MKNIMLQDRSNSLEIMKALTWIAGRGEGGVYACQHVYVCETEREKKRETERQTQKEGERG